MPHIPETDIRYSFALAGGSLMDLGCYPVQWVRTVVGEEPLIRSAEAAEGPAGIDVTMTAELEFPGGATGSIHCSMDPTCTLRADLIVTGTEGSLHVMNPLAPQLGHLLTIRTSDGERSEQVDGRTTYEHQLEAFVATLLDGVEVPTGGIDAINSMKAIDAIYTASGLPIRGT